MNTILITKQKPAYIFRQLTFSASLHFLLVHFDKDLSHRDHGLIIHLASGHLGAQLNPSAFQQEARTFLDEFDRIYPGAKQQVSYDDRRHILGHLEQWTSNPFTKGSYLC
ncbi:hypothetical protein [Alkalinema sp. FACHB-956]|uniref:hypothetical protein n=1 Tax=Alkalinema sp. FACHB-956 TaxID=2692768 RepID=UPI00168691B1|nr:hypothetical protein [Alkalinema sp. FACHB-956]MBD2329036.1 hypothetical protein [Alkalinema sp. FACHB-956]